MGTTHAIPVGDQVISQMHASLNLGTSTRWKSQKGLNLIPPSDPFSLSFFHFRKMESKYPLHWMESISWWKDWEMEMEDWERKWIWRGDQVETLPWTQDTYNRHFNETLLQPSDIPLHTHTGNPVHVSGQILVKLTTKIRMSLCHLRTPHSSRLWTTPL